MADDQKRLTLAEAVAFIDRTYGLTLSATALEGICEGGWSPCARSPAGDWSVDPAEIERSWEATVRLLGLQAEMEYVERRAAEDVMAEPPSGAEAEENL